jgi:TRAP-type uncharacterized transport system substrate-binding protein
MDSIKAFLKANAWLALAIVVIAVALYQFVDPAPPREITIATGDEEGRYFELGEYLKAQLRQEGVTLNVISTAGSKENMDLLIDADSDVSIALVQSGMEEIFDHGEAVLGSLGSLYYEPIRIFYRGEIALIP